MNERWVVDGKAVPLEDMTKEQLIEAVRYLMAAAEAQAARTRHLFDVWQECQEARNKQWWAEGVERAIGIDRSPTSWWK